MASIKGVVYKLLHDRSQFCDSIVRNFLGFLPDKLYLSLIYRCRMGHWINWKNPKTFTEKLQWLKVYDYKPEYTKMVDKLAVKDYVASRIGEEYIIPTLGVWDRVEDIDWDSLPDQFVLKTTHGGGGCGVVVCSDKTHFDKAKAIKKLQTSMHSNTGKTYREKPYLNVPRKIIAEKFMAERKAKENAKISDLPDYKFFCFNGEPHYCQVIRDRHTKETIDFYDMEWNHMPFVGLNPIAMNGVEPVAKPVHLEQMKEICRKLSKDIKFSRIDLYVIDDKEYFGEITFYPVAGFGEFTPTDWNERLGELINLDGNVCGGGIFKILGKKIEFTPITIERNDLQDYKFFCFDGEPKFLYVSDSPNHKLAFLNTDWTIASIGRKDYKPLLNIPPKPYNLDEMLEVARKLSKGKPHVRVDLYNVNGHIYFGELTFYTGAVFIPFDPRECDKMLGDMLRLPSMG